MKTGPFSNFNAHGRFSLGGSHLQWELPSRFSSSSHLRFSLRAGLRTGSGFQPTRENHPTLQKTPPKSPHAPSKSLKCLPRTSSPPLPSRSQSKSWYSQLLGLSTYFLASHGIFTFWSQFWRRTHVLNPIFFQNRPQSVFPKPGPRPQSGWLYGSLELRAKKLIGMRHPVKLPVNLRISLMCVQLHYSHEQPACDEDSTADTSASHFCCLNIVCMPNGSSQMGHFTWGRPKMANTFSLLTQNSEIPASAIFFNLLMLHQKWRSATRGFSQICLQDK